MPAESEHLEALLYSFPSSSSSPLIKHSQFPGQSSVLPLLEGLIYVSLSVTPSPEVSECLISAALLFLLPFSSPIYYLCLFGRELSEAPGSFSSFAVLSPPFHDCQFKFITTFSQPIKLYMGQQVISQLSALNE